jgi:hypothetical protein
MRALLAGKAAHGRASRVVRHGASLSSARVNARRLRTTRNAGAPCGAPSSVTLRVTPSPASGEGVRIVGAGDNCRRASQA